MISQCFIGRLPVSLRDEFPTHRNLLANVVGLNNLLARVRCRKRLCRLFCASRRNDQMICRAANDSPVHSKDSRRVDNALRRLNRLSQR